VYRRRARVSCSRCAAGASIAAVVLASSIAAAQPAKPTQAEILFREGREAATRGDIKTACARFDESVRLARAPGPLMNLADCEEQKGRLASAAKLWQEAIQRLDASDDRLSFAKSRLDSLDLRLPRITVRTRPEVSDAQVEIDGVEVDAGAPQPVDPGDHKIVVRAGERSGSADAKVAEGDRKQIIVPLAQGSAGVTPPPADPPSGAMRTAGFIAGGVGLAGLAVFGVTAGLIAGHRGAVSEACNEAKQCTPEGLDAVGSARSLLPVNAVGFVVGVVGLVAGVTLILLSPSPSKPALALRVGGAPSAFSTSVVGTF
jgi:hypothetical protein